MNQYLHLGKCKGLMGLTIQWENKKPQQLSYADTPYSVREL